MNILYYLIGLVVLVILLKIISLPLKIIIKFIVNSIIGGIVLWILAFFGIVVVVNTTMIILTGLFGIPGLVFAILLTIIL
ncbi:MAG: pro-sigmaK processing inhibitor BofA family protein [Clostridia bacterium]|nr:pro-sigmaK processing inhibitor BofA family protein [Clostridia bacterium]